MILVCDWINWAIYLEVSRSYLLFCLTEAGTLLALSVVYFTCELNVSPLPVWVALDVGCTCGAQRKASDDAPTKRFSLEPDGLTSIWAGYLTITDRLASVTSLTDQPGIGEHAILPALALRTASEGVGKCHNGGQLRN